MSRRQAVPSNWYVRDADPLPPLFEQPEDGDHYFNSATQSIRVFIDGKWQNATVGSQPTHSQLAGLDVGDDHPQYLNTERGNQQYVRVTMLRTSTSPASGTAEVGTVHIQY